MLSRMFWPEFPVPVGVLRATSRPTHDRLLEDQLWLRSPSPGRATWNVCCEAERRGRSSRRRSRRHRRRSGSRHAGGMICSSCGFENLVGADTCDNCGADLAGHDVPQATVSFHGRLLGEHLDELGAPSPWRSARYAARRRHRADARGEDRLRARGGGDRLVGIFTDRDAVVKAAGKPPGFVPRPRLHDSDPVVLRHDDPIAVAIHKMAVGGFRTSRSWRTAARPAW